MAAFLSRTSASVTVFINFATDPKVTEQVAEQSLNQEMVPNRIQTISTTMADTGTAMIVQPIPSNSLVHRPLPDQTPTKMLERMLQVPNFTWTVGTAASLTTPAMKFDPFSLLLNLPVVQNIVQWYYFIRADVEMHFRLNTNQFYAGALALTASPGDPPSVGGPSSTQQGRSWLGMKILSAAKQDTVVLTLPWCYPQRFVPITDITGGGTRIWTVYLDILSPLAASVSTPVNVDVSVFLCFKNAQLVLPYQVAPGPRGSAGLSKTIQKQSGESTMRVPTDSYKATRKVIHVSRATKDPVAEANAPTNPSPLSTVGTLLNAIPEVGPIISEATSALQPIMGVLGGLLDKPENQNPVTRVAPFMGSDTCQADRHDMSLPLALYETSYLNVDPSTMPGGENWTFARVAQTPALHSQFTFTPSALTVTIPFLAQGTPLSMCVGTHAFWRSSVRFYVKFFCPAFISSRILFVLSPGTAPTTAELSNNLSRVVDVKGDTTDQFTVPFICPTDFYPSFTLPTATAFPDLLTLQISVLNQIVTNDVSTTAKIDMIIFSAAGPDCQFAGPISGLKMDYSYPNTTTSLANRKARRKALESQQTNARKRQDKKDKLDPSWGIIKQCDVFEEFKATFNPFLMDCEYLADSHHVSSETSVYVTDLLKRYCVCFGLPGTGNVTHPPALFTPDEETIQYLWTRAFLFKRGGTRYKFVHNDSDFISFVGWGVDDPTWNGDFAGGACLYAASLGNTQEVAFSVPYISTVPYYSDVINVTGVQPPVTWYTETVPVADFVQLTAVRDDFQLGFLIPPDLVI